MLLLMIACLGGDDDKRFGGGDDTASPGSTRLCSEWLPVDESHTWDYAYTDEVVEETGSDASWRSISTGEASSDGSFSVQTDGEILNSAYADYVYTSDVRYRCDTQGVWLLETFTITNYSLDGQNYSTIQTTTTWDTPPLIIPSSIEVGTEWSYTGSGTSTTQGSTPQSFSLDQVHTAVGEQETTVPAGTYTTIQIDVATDAPYSYWTARGVGTILSDSHELTGFAPN